ncbi:MAG TPA: mannonate dehydratase [Acidobacteriaceae bacterium]|jgi:mannonate dehydratase|nr:mannonate dehydratase [Acidobacteriaceae bacterium]
MEQTWRWFGPRDKVSLADASQAGAEGIVSALHNLPAGHVWPIDAIREHQRIIAAAGLHWSVVESLDVTERIKLRERGFQQDIDNYIQSLRNLSACGLRIIAYNLMPVFNWMRTELNRPLPNGAYATRFDATAFAVFDLHMLCRKNAEADWGEERCRAAHALFASLSESDRANLQSTVLQGLPGGGRAFTIPQLQRGLDQYCDVDAAAFRANIAAFLREVCPVAQELGIRLSVHPDDPPFPLAGLPRIVSTADDLAFLLEQWPEEANGITFCTGALGVRGDNNLVEMARRFSSRIWFAHLRSTQRDADGIGFTEAPHLEGDTDVIGVTVELVKEERRRRSLGDSGPLPFRPDHGQQLLNDIKRKAQAGYPAIGRLRGLAELRGIIFTAERLLSL